MKASLPSFPFWLVTLLILSACATIKSPTFNKYYEAGVVAERQGDYAAAKENYYRALVNARVGLLSRKETAAAAYAYGKMLGVYCDYQGAEELLLEAKDLDQKVKWPSYIPLLELARIKTAQGDYQAAVKYFEQTLRLVDKKQFIESDPIAFAEVLQNYSVALGRLQRSADAQSAAARAETLRRAHPGGKPLAGPPPYGSQCPDGQAAPSDR
jgi:tetratricopeptide (TPR) repeat protein